MKPRLAIFVATSGHSGVDRIVANLAPAIAEQGILVDVLRVRGHGPRVPDDVEDLRVVELPAAHAYTALAALVRYLRRWRPDAVLSDKDRVNRVTILARALARSGSRLVVRTGTTVSQDLRQRDPVDRLLTRASMRYLYRFADAIAVPCEAAADDMALTIGIPRTRIRSVPSPVVTPDLRSRAAEPLPLDLLPPGDGPLIVGVGELSLRKDYATLLRAFARLDTGLRARMLILGEGRERSALEHLAAKLGITERVRLPGFVTNPYPAIAKADVFAHTSKWEGFGNVLVEAMAVGTPIVATDCPGGPREILDGGRYGRLVPVDDDAALAQTIVELLEAPPDPTEVCAGATRYTVAASRDAYLDVLQLQPGKD